MSRGRNRFFSKNTELERLLQTSVDDYKDRMRDVETRVQAYRDLLEVEAEKEMLDAMAYGIEQGVGITEILYLMNTKTWSIGERIFEKAKDRDYDVQRVLTGTLGDDSPIETFQTESGRTAVRVRYSYDRLGNRTEELAGLEVLMGYNESKDEWSMYMRFEGAVEHESSYVFKSYREDLAEIWEMVEKVLKNEETVS